MNYTAHNLKGSFIMRHLFAIFCLVSAFLTGATSAVANEADVHLRVSYHLYRAAGYNDEISKYLSITNQYIDMSAASSPMLFSSQRQLFHFPGDLEKINVDGHGNFGFLSNFFESKLSLAERNHPLANYLIYKGMKTGDLQTFGFGFHTKIDGTGAHVGYSNMLGHLTDGHNPDRVFLEPGKFENMVRSLLQSLIQARQLLPPEMLDIEGSLKYLNTLAPETYLKRQLTAADLNDASLVSMVVLSDAKLQQIIREDIFKKYEYKWIALNRIYESFKSQKIIHADLKFSQLFLNEWMKDTSMDVNDVIRACIIKTFHSGFLTDVNQTKVFDLKRFLGVTTLDNFLLKVATEKKRYENRIRQHLDILEKIKNGLVLDSAMAERVMQEGDVLLTGVAPDSEDQILSEEMIQKRSQQLAEARIADDFVLKLTKDFIPMDPRKYSEYVKQNFEGETINRKFEVKYKDEAFRRFFSVVWGTNWVLADVKFTEQVKIAAKKFKNFILRLPNIEAKKEAWERLAERAAENLFSDLVTPSSEFAQKIKYNFQNKINAFIKLSSYTAPAIPLFIGFKYVQRLLKEAKAYARDHEVEDIARALEDKKYKKFEDGKSKAAFKNIQQIKQQTKFQCSYLF
jgi:hypothetical protein